MKHGPRQSEWSGNTFVIPTCKQRTESVVPSYRASKQQGSNVSSGLWTPELVLVSGHSKHHHGPMACGPTALGTWRAPARTENAQSLSPWHSQPGNLCPTCCLLRTEVLDGRSHLLPWNLGLPAPLLSLLRFPKSSCEHDSAPYPIIKLHS